MFGAWRNYALGSDNPLAFERSMVAGASVPGKKCIVKRDFVAQCGAGEYLDSACKGSSFA